MKKCLRSALFLIAACAIPTWALAATVYKCGNSYSQVPCADGVELNTSAGPSAQQQRAARKAAEQDEKTARTMEKERLDAEKAAIKAQQAATKTQPHDKAAPKEKATGTKTKNKEPEFFTAKAPGTKASQPK